MRRTVRRQHVGVALFPFLAVLICTMGSLIVLLVLLVQQARLDARQVAAEQAVDASANEQQFQQQLEEAQWKREMLEQSRAEKTQELADSRAKLSHLEDHIQRLAARARELMERAQTIDKGQQLQDDQLAAARAELTKLQSEIAKKQAELDDARKKLKTQEQWFALIPYEGPHGTRRQPIYIECTEQGVVLQPEGILFSTDDFNGPLGPHNPLDAALRTVREHRTALARGAGEPYPLLVVRPSGIVAYGAARAALKDWDEEFGYELVGDDKRLVFGSPDPALAAALAKSVAIARRRQAAMAAMMPRRYQGDEPLTSFSPDALSEKSQGSMTPGGPGSGTGHGATGSIAGNRTGGSGGTALGGAPGPALGNPRPGLAGDGVSDSAFASSGYFGAPGAPGAPGSGSGGSATGNTGGNTNTAAPSGANVAAGPYGRATGGQATGGQASGGQAGGSPAGTAGANPPGTTAVGSASGGGTAFSGSPAGAAGGETSGSASQQSETQQGGSPSANLQFGPRGQQGGASSGSAASGAAAAAQGRGRDWALPGASRHATAITRPIHVAVLLDRLVLIPERGADRVPLHLRISDRMTVEEIDSFVAAVQREMKSWGLAVRNGYWKPVLQVEVATDSEHHFADLQMSLANSGFEVQRKQP